MEISRFTLRFLTFLSYMASLMLSIRPTSTVAVSVWSHPTLVNYLKDYLEISKAKESFRGHCKRGHRPQTTLEGAIITVVVL